MRRRSRRRIPFLHFFDGFRTSHEVAKIEELTDDDLRSLIPESLVFAHRQRGLTPDRPVLRGTAQNPDVFFQAREAQNGFYDVCPDIVARTMQSFGALTGRHYSLFEYAGDPAADRVIVIMGSGADTVHETVDYMTARGDKVGVLKVRLYRPFDQQAFLAALPKTVRTLAILDRTKEPGAPGDPLYLDVTTALAEAVAAGVSPFAVPPRLVAGRYGLSSKEFTPAMIKGIFDNIAQDKPKHHFTVGIVDDVTHLSLPWDPSFKTESDDVSASLFYGLGADGTVGANKNSIKIVGQETELFAQGYFVYDSKKSGAITVSHLRTSKTADPIRVPGQPRRLRRLSSVRVRRQDRRPRTCGAWRRVSAERAVPRGRGVGSPADGDAGADRREEAPLFRDRRLRARQAFRHGHAHQHHHADLLLLDLGDPPRGRSDQAHQEVD